MVYTRTSKRIKLDFDESEPDLDYIEDQEIDEGDLSEDTDTDETDTNTDTDTDELNSGLEMVLNDELRDTLLNLNESQVGVLEMIRSVYYGDFFQTNLITSAVNTVKDMSDEKAQECVEKFKKLKEHYSYDNLDLVNLVDNLNPTNKQDTLDILDNVYGVLTTEPMTEDYFLLTQELRTQLKRYKDRETDRESTNTLPKSVYDMTTEDLRQRCKELNTTDANKKMIYSCIEKTQYSGEDSIKYKSWLDTVFKIPFGKYTSETQTDLPLATRLHNVRKSMDDSILFMEDAKDKILTMIPNESITAIALNGERGTGKSTIGKVIADSLGRPFKMISLGGESDPSTMMGHNMTYIGSKCGSIIDAIIESQCMDPVILIDELDKIEMGNNGNGSSLYGFLTHLVDKTTNLHFTGDRYLGNLEIDMSRVMFIFTYNDESVINKILLDRMFKITVEDYTTIQKKTIVIQSLLPKILNKNDISVDFTEEALDTIVSNRGPGLRTIKHILEHIVARVKLLVLLTPDTYKSVVTLKYNRLFEQYKTSYHTTGRVIVNKQDLTDLLQGLTTKDKQLELIKHAMYT